MLQEAPHGSRDAPLTATDLGVLAASFRRTLRARNRSPRTVQGYLDGVDTLVAYLAREGLPTIAAELRREHIEAFLGDQLERHTANTAATRYRALQQFFRWLAEEGESPASPMVGLHAPMIPEAPPPILSDDEIRRLLRVCEGPDLHKRRDAAISRLLADTGMRAPRSRGCASRMSTSTPVP